MLHTGFDDLIEKHRGKVPLAFMRALAFRESGLNPKLDNDGAIGLYQIRGGALKDFNKITGKNWSKDDLLIPEKNIELAGWFLNHVIERWNKHPSLRPDWNTDRFPALLAFGWNAGWSEGTGLALCVTRLEEIKADPITVEMVRQTALITPKASKYLTDPARARWSEKVAATFLRMKPQQVASRSQDGSGWGLLALLGLGAGALIISRS